MASPAVVDNQVDHPAGTCSPSMFLGVTQSRIRVQSSSLSSWLHIQVFFPFLRNPILWVVDTSAIVGTVGICRWSSLFPPGMTIHIPISFTPLLYYDFRTWWPKRRNLFSKHTTHLWPTFSSQLCNSDYGFCCRSSLFTPDTVCYESRRWKTPILSLVRNEWRGRGEEEGVFLFSFSFSYFPLKINLS